MVLSVSVSLLPLDSSNEYVRIVFAIVAVLISSTNVVSSVQPGGRPELP